jgi:hypothetical protein
MVGMKEGILNEHQVTFYIYISSEKCNISVREALSFPARKKVTVKGI